MITIYSTIHEYLHFWNDTINISDNLRKKHVKFIENYFVPCLGTIRLDQYNETHARMLRQSLLDNPNITDAVCDTILCAFRQAMRYAKDQLLIKDSFCDFLDFNYCPDTRIRIYTPDEIKAIFSALEYEPFGNYYKLIYHTCIRSSEARAIRLSDIDITNRSLHIRQRIYGNNESDYYVDSLENGYEDRIIYLTEQSLSVLLNELELNKRKRSCPSWKDNGENFLFIRRSGAPFMGTTTQRTRYVVEKITGVTNFCTDSLRYTGINALVKSGATEKEVQDYLGFSDLPYVYHIIDKARIRRNS